MTSEYLKLGSGQFVIFYGVNKKDTELTQSRF